MSNAFADIRRSVDKTAHCQIYLVFLRYNRLTVGISHRNEFIIRVWPPGGVLALRRQWFQGVDDAVPFANTLEPSEHYDMQCQLRGQFMQLSKRVEFHIEKFYDWVTANSAWKEAADARTFPADVAEVSMRAKHQRNRTYETKRRVLQTWTKEQADALGGYVYVFR